METGKVINRISNRLRRRSAALQETLGMSGAQGYTACVWAFQLSWLSA